jgi:BlaI family penicillinase repressor
MQLTTTEEQLMHHLWKLENAFLKDLIELYPDPKPATTTVATLLKRMTDKQFVGYNVQGNTRIYFPLVSKNEYFSKHVNGLIKNFFDNSASQFASFFTTATNLTEKELKDLRALVENELKKKKHE